MTQATKMVIPEVEEIVNKFIQTEYLPFAASLTAIPVSVASTFTNTGSTAANAGSYVHHSEILNDELIPNDAYPF